MKKDALDIVQYLGHPLWFYFTKVFIGRQELFLFLLLQEDDGFLCDD